MIHHGDLFDVLPGFTAASIDAVVTDPPYGIGFMGREWDTFKPGVEEARIVPNKQIASDNPNLHGRVRGPASSPASVEYDYTVKGLREFQDWTQRWAAEAFRVMKPGAYIVVCCAPRSYHRMACGLEEAGFVIRDSFAWLFSTGFPKSHNFGCKCGGNAVPCSHAGVSTPERNVRRVFDCDVSQADGVGEESREILLEGVPEQGLPAHGQTDGAGLDARGEQSGLEWRELHRTGEGLSDDSDAGTPKGASERVRSGAHSGSGEGTGAETEAERGSASQGSRSGEQRPGQSASLRLPSRTLVGGTPDRSSRCERCGGLTAARGQGTALKPAHEKIALAWKPFRGTIADNYIKHGTAALNIDACRIKSGPDHAEKCASVVGLSSNRNGACYGEWNGEREDSHSPLGRWPSNVLLDEEAAAELDEQSGELAGPGGPASVGTGASWLGSGHPQGRIYDGESGGASRFFYVAKPSRAEREQGCDGLTMRQRDDTRKEGNPGGDNPRNRGLQLRGNCHPTVKPVELMRYLVRLVTPKGGTVLDPFTGSGTTGMACAYEGVKFIGIEREAEYVEIATRRIASCLPLFGEVSA